MPCSATPSRDSTLESSCRASVRRSRSRVTSRPWCAATATRLRPGSRRFAVHPRWAGCCGWRAYGAERPETAIRYFQYADSVRQLKATRWRGVLRAGRALHQLGRYERRKLAERMRERFPDYPTEYRTIEVMGRAGLGISKGSPSRRRPKPRWSPRAAAFRYARIYRRAGALAWASG
jgi:hypothetical protein